jgi:hypothetical protein
MSHTQNNYSISQSLPKLGELVGAHHPAMVFLPVRADEEKGGHGRIVGKVSKVSKVSD